MAAWLGSYGTAAFGEKEYPAPGAVIMQYTGLSEVYGNEPPTYACVGVNDGIASYRTMERRIRMGLPGRLKFLTAFLMALAWGKEPWQRDGSTGLWRFGKRTQINKADTFRLIQGNKK